MFECLLLQGDFSPDKENTKSELSAVTITKEMKSDMQCEKKITLQNGPA